MRFYDLWIIQHVLSLPIACSCRIEAMKLLLVLALAQLAFSFELTDPDWVAFKVSSRSEACETELRLECRAHSCDHRRHLESLSQRPELIFV